MKIGFNRGGLTVNGKMFNPLNLTIDGHGIETNEALPTTDPFDVLENLSAARGEGVTRLDQIQALQKVLKK